MKPALLGIVLFAISCTCQQPGPQALVVEPVRLAPDALDFPDTYLSASRTLWVTVTNPGRVSRQLTFAAAAPFSAPSTVALAAGEEVEVAIQFAPSTAGIFTAMLTMDDEISLTEIPVRGIGLEWLSCVSEVCRSSTFDPSEGRCVDVLAPEGTSCTSSYACFVRAECASGVCRGTTVTCDDGKVCTLDVCSDLGCGQVDRTPFCPLSPNPCLVPSCTGDAGCELVGVPDGTACGERTCSTALVCINSNCVTRVPPKNQACADVLVGVPAGVGYNDGRGDQARFARPMSIAVDGDSAVFFDSQSLRRVRPDGLVTTLAGAYLTPGHRDGYGSAARFSSQVRVASTAIPGMTFIGDGQTMRLLTASGLITTIAGVPNDGGVVDGVGVHARLSVDSNMVTTAQGTVLFLQRVERSLGDLERLVVREASVTGEVRTRASFPLSAMPAYDPANIDRAWGELLDTGTAELEACVTLVLQSGGAPSWRVGLVNDGGVTISARCPLREWRRGAVTTSLGSSSDLSSTRDGGLLWSFYGSGPSSDGALEANGGVWVTHYRLIRRIENGVVTMLAGPVPDARTVNGPPDAGRLQYPLGLALEGSGTLFFGDFGTVRRLTLGDRSLSSIGIANSSSQADGPWASARFASPRVMGPWAGGIVVDDDGVIRTLDAASATVSTLVRRPVQLHGLASNGVDIKGLTIGRDAVVSMELDGGSTPFAGGFSQASALAAGPNGTWVLAGDTDPAAAAPTRLYEVSATGVVTLLAGQTNTLDVVDGPALQAHLGYIEKIAVAPDGSVYFTAQGSNWVRQLRHGQVTRVIELADHPMEILVEPAGSVLVGVEAAILRVVP